MNFEAMTVLSCVNIVRNWLLLGMEETMRRIILATAATLTLLAAGPFAPARTEAMTITTPTGLMSAIDGTSLAQDVAYVCRRVRRCGPNGCIWRRVCWWTGPRPYYYGYGPYYYGRPYYRRYWW
jgi:hypothetical protein